jgi:hypothetical protein
MGAAAEPGLPRLMLVFLALATGSGWRDAGAAARSGAPGFDRANARLPTCGPAGVSMGRDRAKALRTLTQQGLGCPSIPAVFPLGHALAQRSARAICGRRRHATRELAHPAPHLEQVPKHTQADPAPVAQAQARGAAWATAVHHGQEGGRAGRPRRSHGSRILHPGRLADSRRQTSKAGAAP